jgi:beta-xylosidase
MGDQGNGTYVNPTLNADYSDSDVIRVYDCYYMVASDFHFLGMQILNLAKNDDIILQTPFKGNAIYLRMNVNATRNEPLEGCSPCYVLLQHQRKCRTSYFR